MADKHSQDAYRDFERPYKFAGILPILFDDHQGNVVYQVPRRYSSLARVLDRKRLYTFRPIERVSYREQLLTYSDFVEQGPDVPTTTRWDGTDSISVHTAEGVQAGQSVLVQVTYDPAWRAYAGSTELPIRADAMDFMAVDVPVGTRDIVLRFEMPLENRIGYVVSGLATICCAWLGIVAWRTGAPVVPEPGGGGGYPFYFRTLRALLRWVNRHLPDLPVADDLARFDREKLRRAEQALQTMKTEG